MRHRGFASRQILNHWTNREVLACVCWLPVSYPRLPAPGGRIFGSSTAILFEPGTSAQHRALSLCVLKGNERPCSFHLHSLHLVPQTSPPLAPEISGLVLGDQLLASGQGGQKPQECRGQNNVCGREDLPQASALGFSYSFLKAGKAIFWPRAPRGAASEVLTEKSHRLRCSFFGEGERAQQARPG